MADSNYPTDKSKEEEAQEELSDLARTRTTTSQTSPHQSLMFSDDNMMTHLAISRASTSSDQSRHTPRPQPLDMRSPAGFPSFPQYQSTPLFGSGLQTESQSKLSGASHISGSLSRTTGSGSSPKPPDWSFTDIPDLNRSSLVVSDWPVDAQDIEALQEHGITFPGTDQGECIGQGGFGEIWLAQTSLTDGTTVLLACKKISLEFYRREGKTLQRSQELLMNEMRAHEMAKHPHVVSVTHVYQVFARQVGYNQPITVLIFMDLCDGDLSKQLRKPKVVPMPEPIACQWFVQMALAVQYLHSIGIAHRDIKPQNILFKRGLIPGTCTFKMTDFGLVKIFDENDVSLKAPAMSTTILGTEDFMAPEMVNRQDGEQYDTFLTDVYSLGVCLLQSLKLMFKSLIEKFGKDRVHEIQKRVSDKFSEDVKSLLKGMLMFDPNNRLTIGQVLEHRWTKQIEYHEYYDMGPNWN